MYFEGREYLYFSFIIPRLEYKIRVSKIAVVLQHESNYKSSYTRARYRNLCMHEKTSFISFKIMF